MDKVELGIKLEQIDNLKQKNDYSGAAKVADSIEWRKVKKWSELSVAVDIYEQAGRLADARNVCVYAYNRSLGGRRLIYKLTDLSIKLKDFDEADELYHEFVQMAPHDMSRYVLLYQLNTARGASVDRLIEILEEYKQNELDEQYEYELASLYSQAGRIDECIKECDDIILWFADGEYVEKALKLKKSHTELTKSQQTKLDLMETYGASETETVFDTDKKKEDEIKVPVKDYSIYDTQNVQAALAQSMDLILKTIHDTDKKNGVPVEDLSEAKQEAEISSITADIDEVDEPTKELRINTHHWNRVRSEMVAPEDIQAAATREATAPGNITENEPVSTEEQQETESEEDDQIEGQMSIMDWLSAAGIETVDDARQLSGYEDDKDHSDITEESVFTPAAVDDSADISTPVAVDAPEVIDTPVAVDAPVAPVPVVPEPVIPATPEPAQPEPEVPQTPEITEPEIHQPEMPEHSEPEIPATDIPEPVIPQPEIPVPDITVVPGTPYMESVPEEEIAPKDVIAQEDVVETDTEEPVPEETPQDEPEEELKADDPEDELEKLITDQINAITEELKKEAAIASEEASAANTDTVDTPEESTDEPTQGPQEEEREESDDSQDELSFDDEDEPEEPQEVSDEEKYNVDNSYHMHNEEKKYLAKYLFMKGMEDNLSELIGGKKKETSSNSSMTGNIVITGKKNTDKTAFAINIFKALHAFDEVREQKVAKTQADNLNKSNLESTFKKIKGTTLIVENAGALSREKAAAFSTFMEGDTNGMLVIFIDQEYEINKLFTENPELAAKFPYRLNLQHYSVNELVEMAKEYAKNKGYVIEDKALLKLYLLVDELKGDDSGSELTSVKDIINSAIARSEGRSMSIFKKKVRGMTVLKEKDFETR